METPHNVPPKRWKVALLIWIFIFPFISVVPILLSPVLLKLAVWQRPLAMSLILVAIMVYFYLPFLHKRFSKWLRK